MKKRMRQKIPKIHSKKGMTLIELVVGITIIVIVFGATLSAMTNGFTNTLYNAEVDKTAARAGSLNEVMMEAAVKQGFASATDVNALYPSGSPKADNPINQAAVSVEPTIEYVQPHLFPAKDKEFQYTIVVNTHSKLKKGGSEYEINGIEIRTVVNSVKGTIYNNSFVAYTTQS